MHQISDVRRGCEKEIASTREKAAHELEEAKSQLGEINRRLEQRFYKLESEYRQFKDAQGELLEGLRVKHRAELAAMHDDRHKATNDLRKEYEQKVDDVWRAHIRVAVR